MRKNKTWSIDLFGQSATSYRETTERVENDEFWTSDTKACLNFKPTREIFDFSSAELTLYNRDDQSLIVKDAEVSEGVASYEMEPEVIAHFGQWTAQVRFIQADNRSFTSGIVDFKVKRALGDGAPSRLTIIKSWDTFFTHAQETIALMEEAELTRAQTEVARQSTFENNETTRQETFTQSELTRAQAELDRHVQEEARKTAEAQREANEDDREANEQTRINKDRSRDDKIAQMEEAEVDRQEAELDRRAQEEAREETHEKVKDLPEAFQTLFKDVSGLNDYSTISTYMNGKLTKIEEKDGLVSKKITILAYGADGKLNSVKESRQGGGTETHLSYEGGGVSTSKTSWVAKTYVLKGSDVFLLETAGTETDYASFRIPKDAVAGTQGVDYVARLYKKDGTEIREIPSTQRTTAEGIGGFYWSTTRVSLVFEKDKYASLEEAKAALAGLVLQYKIK